MGVGVKIILGVAPGGVSGLNFVIAGNFERKLINPDLTVASEPVTVVVDADTNAAVEYEFKG